MPMPRCLVVTLVALLVAAPTFAQGPIATSAAAQTAPVVKTERRNPELYWSGIALAGGGGFLLGYGLTLQQNTSCLVLSTFVTCQETGANRGALIGIGAAGIGAGIFFSAYGGKRIAVAPTRTGVVGRLTF